MALRKLVGAACLLAAAAGWSSSASAALIINEVESDTVNGSAANPINGSTGADPEEFVELYETTGTSVPLDGYVLVFYNGNGNVPYRTEDLDGFSTDSNGYFYAGSIAGADKAIPFNTIQNGVDAIGLYVGNATDFTTGAGGTAPSKTNLVDSVVYKTGADIDGVGLDAALLDAGGIVDEFGRDGSATAGATDSIGRAPNGSGNVRDTTNWTFMTPTPGAANVPEPTGFLLAAGGIAMAGLRRRRNV